VSRPALFRLRRGWPSAGLFLGPAGWGLNTQLGYAAVPWACGNGINIIPVIAAVAMLPALYGAWLSWRAFGPESWTAPENPQGGRPHHLLAGVGVLVGLLFALTILTQAAAAFVLHGCER
jgi:hypothetical protein